MLFFGRLGIFSKLTIFSAVGLVLLVLAMVWSNYLQRVEFPPDVASRDNMAFPLPKEPSMVLLPFVSVAETSDDLLIVDALTRNLYFTLSRQKDFFVISNYTTAKLRGRSLSIKETAERLGVQFIISGSLERTGQGYRFFLIIIDAFTGDRLLAESFDTPWAETAKLESFIVSRIFDVFVDSAKIEDRLGNKKKIASLQNIWVRLSRQLSKRVRHDSESLEDSIKSMEALDNEFPDVFELLLEMAFTYRFLYEIEVNNFSIDRKNYIISQGLLYSDRAIAINDLAPRAQSIKAWFLKLDGQHAKALKFKRRAVELGTNLFRPNWVWAAELEKQKKYKEALVFMNKSLRIHPLHPVKLLQNLAELQYKAGQPNFALATLSKLLSKRPAFIPASLMKIFILSSLGRIKEAKRIARNLLELRPMFNLSDYAKKRPRYILNYGPTWVSLLQGAGLSH